MADEQVTETPIVEETKQEEVKQEQPQLKQPDIDKIVAERLARRGFYIPSGLAIKDEQINCVTEIVRNVLV